jgi:dihydroneopterin aldolase
VTDRIDLTGIKVWARHGVRPDEKKADQLFVVDVTVYSDTTEAAASDDLNDTVDYGSLAQSVHDLVASESHNLIETVADRVATRVLEDPKVGRVIVTVHKPQAPMLVEVGDVSVTVDRSR